MDTATSLKRHLPVSVRSTGKVTPSARKKMANRYFLRPSLLATGLSMIPMLAGFSLAYLVGFLLLNAFDLLRFEPVAEFSKWLSRGTRIVLLLELLRRYYNDLYVFGEYVITHHHGRLSLQYRVTTVKYRDIREIKVQQTILGRVLSYGDVLIGTASTNGYECVIHRIRWPKGLSQWIQTTKVEKRLKREKRIRYEPRESCD